MIFIVIPLFFLILRKGPAAPLNLGFMFTPKRQIFQKNTYSQMLRNIFGHPDSVWRYMNNSCPNCAASKTVAASTMAVGRAKVFLKILSMILYAILCILHEQVFSLPPVFLIRVWPSAAWNILLASTLIWLS